MWNMNHIIVFISQSSLWCKAWVTSLLINVIASCMSYAAGPKRYSYKSVWQYSTRIISNSSVVIQWYGHDGMYLFDGEGVLITWAWCSLMKFSLLANNASSALTLVVEYTRWMRLQLTDWHVLEHKHMSK